MQRIGICIAAFCAAAGIAFAQDGGGKFGSKDFPGLKLPDLGVKLPGHGFEPIEPVKIGGPQGFDIPGISKKWKVPDDQTLPLNIEDTKYNLKFALKSDLDLCRFSGAAPLVTKCRQKVTLRFAGLNGALAGLDTVSQACSEAAGRYRATLVGCDSICTTIQQDALKQQGASFDNACMSAVDGSGLPTVSGGGDNALLATALIETAEGHLCGGLFVSAKRIVTAAHCFERSSTQKAVADGMVWVRSADPKSAQRWKLARSSPWPTASAALGDDYIELDVVGGSLQVPTVRFERPAAYATAFIPGYSSTEIPRGRSSRRAPRRNKSKGCGGPTRAAASSSTVKPTA